MSEWFEDETFWIETFPFMFPRERMEAAPGEVDGMLSLTGLSGGRVLDLCCGPGRHAIEFAKRGFDVTGVDRTAFLLDKAKNDAAQRGLEIEWIRQDMRKFHRRDEFDLALSLFTSFGYFDDRDEDLAVLENVFQSLKPGGLFLIDVMGKERLARIFSPTTSQRLEDGSTLVQLHEVFDGWSRIVNEWILIKDGAAKSYRFHHSIYSGQELKELLERAGFSNVRLYGDLDGNDYGSDAKRLAALSRKAPR
jgi:SAM-dependent methyltransferase